jgi:hypothetical protein
MLCWAHGCLPLPHTGQFFFFFFFYFFFFFFTHTASSASTLPDGTTKDNTHALIHAVSKTK